MDIIQWSSYDKPNALNGLKRGALLFVLSKKDVSLDMSVK